MKKAIDSIEILWPHVVIQKDQLPSSIGQIVLPEARAQRPVSGTIVKVGPGVHPRFEVGGRVAFAEYAGHTLAIDGESITFLNPSEILGIIPPGVELDARP